MHGRIFWEFRDYAEAKYGDRAWRKLLKMAGVEEKVYLQQAYPDSEMVSLVVAASELSGRPVPMVLEEFGEHLTPPLLHMYGHLIKREWRTLDIIEHAERVGHSTARQEEAGMGPPFLRTKRLGPEKLVLIYSSPRKLCALAVGMAKGLGKYFNEEVVIQHSQCMHRGASSCEMVIQAFAAKTIQAKAHSHQSAV